MLHYFLKLHRVTTSKLLPIDYSAAEEVSFKWVWLSNWHLNSMQGLDINQVLNRTLLLKACHILSTDDTS